MTKDQHTHKSFEDTLKQVCRGNVRFDATTRGIYATDASIYQVLPKGVVVPDSADDACNVIRVLGEARVAMLPRGGGTSLAGQCVNDAVVVDLSAHCTGLLECNTSARWCRVQAGMTIDDLNDRISSTGLFFAPDPSTSRQANIGGCIGNNAAGVHSILYGRTSENVLAVDTCLWDGTAVTFDAGAATRDPHALTITNAVLDVVEKYAPLIRQRFPKTMRRSAGYQLDVVLGQLDEFGRDLARINLAPLLCGSEGTLACTLAAKLLLHPVPKAKGLAVIAFGSINDAVCAVERLLPLGPSAVELLDKLILDLAQKNTVYKPYTELLPPAPDGGFPQAVLFVEFFSETGAGEIAEQLARLQPLFPENDIHLYTQADEMSNAWALRRAGEPLLHAIAGDRKPLGFVEDNAVPVKNLARFIEEFRAIIEEEDTIASYYAHASVGVLHVRPLLDLRDPDDEARMIRIARKVADLAKSLGGVPSGEHGDGRARGPLLESYFGPELMEAFREIKGIFDPHNLMNPANIVDPGPIESIAHATRVRPYADPVRVADVETFYSYESQSGFGHAVEMCNGAGVCRKKSSGTMCPSYQATLDERHSTRGRGNALRLAISGQGDTIWDDEGTKEILDLCLSCKACKSECPSNVDIAKLKSEYLAQGYKSAGRTPFRARVFSKVHLLNCFGSVLPQLTNAINRFPPARSVINNTLGIHPLRSLPPFARACRERPIPENGNPKVLVLSDTFSTHNEPQVTDATVRVLEAFGYAVGVVRATDFGRAAISQGCLGDAIKDAQRTLERLKPYIDDPSIVGFLIPEPSCVSAVCDDWMELNLAVSGELREQFARRVALPEVFLEALWDRHPKTPRFGMPTGRIKVHGHCHQKALWGEQSAGSLIARVFPDQADLLDTGCCGMAGSFGYAAHRYDLSMKIGEMTLFPAVRAGSEADVFVASGISCRHQIRDGTTRRAVHAMELLDRLLVPAGD